MTITLNGVETTLAATTVEELLAVRGIDGGSAGVAVAINDRVVRRREWTETTINEGDRVEIITAMQGG